MRKSMLVLAALAIVCACKKNETAAPSTTQSTRMTQSTATTATTAAPPPAQPATQTTASAAAPAAGAIAGTDGEKAGTHVDITELKRTSGGTVNLKLVLSNAGPQKLSVYGDWLGDNHVSKDSYRDISGIHLLDPVNKKKYFVVTDSERGCVCSKNIEDVQVGGKANLWAKFPAPPPEVTKVTIEIPHFQPIDDVPISQ
jgi:hypothetical protein